jgi:hypothetical protein
MADGLPPGVYFNVGVLVAAVVFEGSEPDPAVLAGLTARLGTSGLAITAHP